MRKTAWLLPLLALYGILIIALGRHALAGDESGYAQFAMNLTHGYYSPPGHVDLWWGPGYPLILAPFALLHLPWLAAKLLNALLLWGAVVLFYHTVRQYVTGRVSIVAAYLLGLYPPLLRDLYVLGSETLATFLISAFAFSFSALVRSRGRNKWAWGGASLSLAYLALTKVFFGYVILAGLVLALAYYLWRRAPAFGQAAVVCGLALVLCLPYLFYTFRVTGHVFYWGTSGGESLYWMSTPYANESGDWHNESEWIDAQGRPVPGEAAAQLRLNHEAFFSQTRNLDQVQRDIAFKHQALLNIATHPKKFVMNWFANLGRLFFSYPFSYSEQKLSTFFYLLPNMLLVVIGLFAIYVSYRGARRIPPEIGVLTCFVLIALFGSSLLSAYERMFHIMLPIVGLWLAFVLTNLVKFQLPAATPAYVGVPASRYPETSPAAMYADEPGVR